MLETAVKIVTMIILILVTAIYIIKISIMDYYYLVILIIAPIHLVLSRSQVLF